MQIIKKYIPTIAILYLVFGLVFAFAFAIYYRWSAFSFFSPGFFIVLFTWPLQIGGFVSDVLYYGLAGKPFGT